MAIADPISDDQGMVSMEDLANALHSYLYGAGWLFLTIACSLIGLRLFDWLSPVNFKKEIEKGNMAFAVMVGLYLLGLTFGMLYLAAHIS